MIKLNKPVIVEGKYDKITLENVIDGIIISTDGFGIFKNKEKCQLIRRLAKKNGVIIMTDSDSAGSVIRGYLKKIIGDAPIINVYVPYLKGKEKRKSTPSKEGVLGVEGMSPQILREALNKCGVFEEKITTTPITKNDLFAAGLSGLDNSREKRKSFLSFNDLPPNLSSSAMLDALNALYNLDEFKENVRLWQNSLHKN